MTEICSVAGVSVVFIPDLPRSGASGAARWLSPSKALIQLSLRYKRDDQLWFSFYHEAAHILRRQVRGQIPLDHRLATLDRSEWANPFYYLVPPAEMGKPLLPDEIKRARSFFPQ